MALSIANNFHLSGDGLVVTYEGTSIKGTPILHVQDSRGLREFSGGQIDRAEGPFGELLTVYLSESPDRGHSTFTLTLPSVSLTSGSAHVSTFAVTALHRTSLAGRVSGQAISYTLTQLQGTASIVQS